MKSEAVAAILASEGLAEVAVSSQHARRSFVPQCTIVRRLCDFFFGSLFQKACKHLNRNAAVKQTNKQTSFEESLSETVK